MFRSDESAKVRTLQELAKSSLRLFDIYPAIKEKKGENYIPYTYERLISDAICLGITLRRRGLEGKHIAICGKSSYNWVCAYIAVVAHCGVAVPLSSVLSGEEVARALEKCDVDAIIYDSSCNLSETDESKPRIAFSDIPSMIEAGKATEDDEAFAYVPSPTDTAELAYTSGTEGEAKAVVITHEALCSVMRRLRRAIPAGTDDAVYSILPLSHSYERVCGMLYPLYSGSCISYGEGLHKLSANLRQVKPTFLLCVPYVLERIHSKIWQNIEKKGIGEKVRRAIKLSEAAGPLKDTLRRKLFAEIHDSLGGSLSYIITGGEAVKPETVEGMRKFGITTLQGYGMTESCALISVNRPDMNEYSSAGLALDGSLIDIYNIQSDGIGEIRYRGKNIMSGYYKNDEESAKVLQDGWLYTGDMGYFDRRGFLHIIGRKSNIIRASRNKQIFPEELEAGICESPFVKEAVVVGVTDPETYNLTLTAVVHPNYDSIEELYGEDYTDSAVMKELSYAVREVNAKYAKHKQIQKIIIKREPFEKNENGKILRSEVTDDASYGVGIGL